MWRLLRRLDSVAVAEALRLLDDDAPLDRLLPVMAAVALLRDNQIREVVDAIRAADTDEGGIRANIMWQLPRKAGNDLFITPVMNDLRLRAHIRQLRAVNRFAFYQKVLFRFLPEAFWREIEPSARELATIGEPVRLWWFLRAILPLFGALALDIVLAFVRVVLALLLAVTVLLSPFWLAAGSSLWHAYPFLWQTYHGRILACSVLLLIGLALYRMKAAAQSLYGLAEVGIGLGVCWTSLAPSQPGNLTTILQVAAGVYVIAQGVDNIRAGWSESKPALVRFVELVADLSGRRVGKHLRKALQAVMAKYMDQNPSPKAEAS